MNGRVFVTGDKHGDFSFLPDFCSTLHTSINDVLIILGDAGLNFHGGRSPEELGVKRKIARLPITLLLVRGNHEMRPEDCDNMEVLNNHSFIHGVSVDDPIIPDVLYWEPDIPNVLYANDGGAYHIYGQSYLTIGGAFSVDKEYRLLWNRFWVVNEKLTYEEMLDILDRHDHHRYDHIMTHTCPIEWEPVDLFLSFIDQSKVEKDMEIFLSDVNKYVSWEHWWFGHYHADRMQCGDEGAHMLYHDVYEIMPDRTYKYRLTLLAG